MQRTLGACVAVYLSLLGATVALAPSPPRVPTAAASAAAQLLLTVHVSRHSIKAPSAPDAQNYTSYDFNTSGFGYPPGELTTHGRAYAAAVGRHYGGLYRRPGGPLAGAASCAELSKRLFVYADSESRDQDTARGVLSGLAPGCALPVCCNDSLPGWLFTEGQAARLHPQCTWAGEEAALELVGGNVSAFLNRTAAAELLRLSNITACCGSGTCPAWVSAGACTLLTAANSWRGGYYSTFSGGWNVAAHIAALWFTRYVEGLDSPLAAGEVEPVQARVADALYDVYRSKANTGVIGSDFLAHLAASLDMAAAGAPPPSAAGALRHAADTRLLFYVGHDCQLAWLRHAALDPAGSWRSGQPYPFLSAVVLELWREGTARGLRGGGGAGAGRALVRLYLDAGSPDDLRQLRDPPLSRAPLRMPPECGPAGDSCELSVFIGLLARAANSSCAIEGLAQYIDSHKQVPA